MKHINAAHYAQYKPFGSQAKRAYVELAEYSPSDAFDSRRVDYSREYALDEVVILRLQIRAEFAHDGRELDRFFDRFAD